LVMQQTHSGMAVGGVMLARAVGAILAGPIAGVVLDRFGKDVIMQKTDGQHFKIRAEVMISPQFYAWVFGLETGARIVGPESVVTGMFAQLEAVRNKYDI